MNKNKIDISIEDFFKPIHLDNIPSSYDYGIVKYYTRVAEALSQLAYHSMYLIDYHKRGFLYVSENPLFLLYNFSGSAPELFKFTCRFRTMLTHRSDLC